LSQAVADLKPGDEVEIEYERDGAKTKTKVTLADREVLMAAQSPLGKPLPDFIGKDIDGREIGLADFKGRVVVLDFWATWCGPCLEETPLLQLTWERLKDKGLVWVGVSGDDDESAWREFVKNNRLGGIQLRNHDWGSQLGVEGYPTIYLVDKTGTVQCEVRGDSIAAAAAALLEQ
jgi:peroxiredoxin